MPEKRLLPLNKHICSLVFKVGCERLGLYGGGVSMERLCKMLLCLRQRNPRRSLWLANWSLLDWKTHTFLLNLFFSKPHLPLFPSWSLHPHYSSSFLSTVLLFFFFLLHIFLILSLWGPLFSLPLLSLYLLQSAVSFSITYADLQT